MIRRFQLLHRLALTLVLAGIASKVRAEESPVDPGNDARIPLNSDEAHSVFSADSHWTAGLLTAAAGLFLAAAVIGPIVRAEAPDAVPVAMSHEEDPAADQH